MLLVNMFQDLTDLMCSVRTETTPIHFLSIWVCWWIIRLFLFVKVAGQWKQVKIKKEVSFTAWDKQTRLACWVGMHAWFIAWLLAANLDGKCCLHIMHVNRDVNEDVACWALHTPLFITCSGVTSVILIKCRGLSLTSKPMLALFATENKYVTLEFLC